MEDDWHDGDDHPPDPHERDRLLKEAKRAARAGDEIGMLAALSASGALIGIKRGVMARARARGDHHLHPDDAEFAVTQAVTRAFEKLRGGQRVSDIGAFLLKTANNKVVDRFRERRRINDPDQLDQRQANQEESILDKLVAEECRDDDDYDDDLDSVALRREAYRLAHQLLPQLGQVRVQEVMRYIFEAAEQGAVHVSDREIADALGLTVQTVKKARQRGFERLTRIVAEGGFGQDIIDYLRRHRTE